MPLDLDGSVQEISYEILQKAANAAKDSGIEREIKGFDHPELGTGWAVLDEVGDVILFWKDVAHGALLEYASAERLEAKDGRARAISILATKVFGFQIFF